MKKIDSAVIRETAYVAIVVLLLSAVTELVFLVLGKWDYRVLLGNLLGASAVILNFFLMGLTVQKAVAQDEKSAKKTVQLSQSMRSLMMLVLLAIGALVPVFNIWAVVIPVFFPRIAIALKPLFDKNAKKQGGES